MKACKFSVEYAYCCRIVSDTRRYTQLIRRTSNVIVKLSRHSFTPRYASASLTFFSAVSTALPTRRKSASHRSSTSRGERKLPVVLRTCVSIMKNPTTSSVTLGSWSNGRTFGRIRSDCACAVHQNCGCHVFNWIHAFLSAWYDFRISSRESRALYMWIHSYRGLKST